MADGKKLTGLSAVLAAAALSANCAMHGRGPVTPPPPPTSSAPAQAPSRLSEVMKLLDPENMKKLIDAMSVGDLKKLLTLLPGPGQDLE